MAEVVDGNITNRETADVGKRLKELEGDSRIETPKRMNIHKFF